MSEGNVNKIVEMILKPLIEGLYKSIGRQFGYLVHCKKNIEDFADEVEKLSLTKARVQTRIAENNAEVLHDDVLEWRRKAQSMEDDKSRLLQSKYNLKCLDVCSRYRLGKEGKKKKPDVTKLIEDCNNFGDVGYQHPLTGIWHKTYSINYESFQSMEFVFEEIMKALKDDGTYKIGIHGMPCVGKTRMMEEVSQQAQKESLFDEVAEIVVSHNPILTDIQQKLAKSLNLKLNEEPENARKARIYDRLRNGKNILVMVDDIWNNKIKLEDIGITTVDNHTKGCNIILISRIKEVRLWMSEKEFEIGVLFGT
ncbi:probable disease resistance protein At5g63020 [Cornus florida]|uniref:probable disease resistance protein At5g63020 n=1 Tax=Cornus florida TaxID=4283 RepID=UPI00289F2432|nr:probable disease resistance protein At5g63020 [Cornus florida]